MDITCFSSLEKFRKSWSLHAARRNIGSTIPRSEDNVFCERFNRLPLMGIFGQRGITLFVTSASLALVGLGRRVQSSNEGSRPAGRRGNRKTSIKNQGATQHHSHQPWFLNRYCLFATARRLPKAANVTINSIEISLTWADREKFAHLKKFPARHMRGTNLNRLGP